MSSGKSEGSHSGPYGAAVITSFCWFSGQSDPSMKFISCSLILKRIEKVVSERLSPTMPARSIFRWQGA